MLPVEQQQYKPLPDGLYIAASWIKGKGLFTEYQIPIDTNIGESHMINPFNENDLIRYPLGGWINHSDNPNCILKIRVKQYGINSITVYDLVSICNIDTGDELTVNYNKHKKCGTVCQNL